MLSLSAVNAKCKMSNDVKPKEITFAGVSAFGIWHLPIGIDSDHGFLATASSELPIGILT